MTSCVDRCGEHIKVSEEWKGQNVPGTLILRSHKHAGDSECQGGKRNCKLRVTRTIRAACW